MFVNRKPRRSVSAAGSAAAPARRVPTQERSRQRVERILDAAGHVFASQGFEAATMEAIAEGAETSIGSIYQFFPNKLAVFNALAARYRDTVRQFFDALVEGPLLERPWPEILEAAIDAFVRFHDSDPAFRAVWVGPHVTEQVISEGEALNREFARRLEGVLTKKLPRLPAKRRPVVATMIVEIVSAMLILSARRDPREGKGLIAEAKTMLSRYLAPYEVRSSAG